VTLQVTDPQHVVVYSEVEEPVTMNGSPLKSPRSREVCECALLVATEAEFTTTILLDNIVYKRHKAERQLTTAQS
jgi:hypothetical protein